MRLERPSTDAPPPQFPASLGLHRALIPFPLDHGVWGARASWIFNHMKETNEANGFQGKYDLWVTGTVSPRTRRELTALGIEATENVDEKIGILD